MFRLPWQPIKFNGSANIHLFGKGLRMEHFRKTFVKIYAVTENKRPTFSFLIVSLSKVVVIATKAHKQRQQKT